MSPRPPSIAALAWTLVAIAGGATASLLTRGAPETPAAAPLEPDADRTGELVVFAAASLRPAFDGLARAFEASHPRAHVVLHFAGSHELRAQLEDGAHADVFAAADPRLVDELVRRGRLREPVTFARNALVLATTPASDVHAFADLPRARAIVVGARDVPVGRYADLVLARATERGDPSFKARVDARVVSREPNARQVLARVVLGEADAAIVYRSDARSAGDRVRLVSIPDALNEVVAYPVAIVDDSRHPALAREWVELLGSAAGQQALVAAGFASSPGAPP